MATGDENVIAIADDGDEEVSSSGDAPSSSVSPESSRSPKPGESSESTIECPICLQTCIHPARLPCGHIFCFLCVKGVAYKNRRCAMCRSEIPPEFLDHPQLVNGIQDICKTKATEDGYQWFYEGRNGGWWTYDPRTTTELEESFRQSPIDNIDVMICGTLYTIDFLNMIQFVKDAPRCSRKICRAKDIPNKGVAGIAFGSGKRS